MREEFFNGANVAPDISDFNQENNLRGFASAAGITEGQAAEFLSHQVKVMHNMSISDAIYAEAFSPIIDLLCRSYPIFDAHMAATMALGRSFIVDEEIPSFFEQARIGLNLFIHQCRAQQTRSPGLN